MSHETGKIEMVGISEGKVFFKYNRSAEADNDGKFLVFKSNPDAYWFDDYEEALEELPKNCSENTAAF